MTQEVTVIAQQEGIETATASRGLNFDPIKTQEYPLNGRQTYMLMSLTPGVIFTQEAFGSDRLLRHPRLGREQSVQDQRRPHGHQPVPAERRADQRQGRQLAVGAERRSGAGIQGHDEHLRCRSTAGLTAASSTQP